MYFKLCNTLGHDTDIAGSDETLRLFALLIGINSYADKTLSPLRGAINDVNDFKKYLKTKLRIPCDQIITLTEDQATRSAIIQSFKKLATDGRIENGDAILIYYAGHGAQLDPPQNHEAGGADSKIQAIIPYDCGCADTENKLIPPIFDYTLEKLLSYIAQKKGDNIVGCNVFLFYSHLIYLVYRRSSWILAFPVRARDLNLQSLPRMFIQ